MTQPDDLPDLLRRVAAGPLPVGFERREVRIDAAGSLGFVEADWAEALIVVAEGTVEVTCRKGGQRSFAAGDTIWFDGLEVATLANPGVTTLVLVAVRRTLHL